METVNFDYTNLIEEIAEIKQMYPSLQFKEIKDGYKLTIKTNTHGKLTWEVDTRDELISLLSGLYWGFHINISKA